MEKGGGDDGEVGEGIRGLLPLHFDPDTDTQLLCHKYLCLRRVGESCIFKEVDSERPLWYGKSRLCLKLAVEFYYQTVQSSSFPPGGKCEGEKLIHQPDYKTKNLGSSSSEVSLKTGRKSEV